MKLSKYIFAIFFFCMAVAVYASNPIARPSVNGKLHVEGTVLRDSNGDLAILKGTSTHGLTWFPQFVNTSLFKQLSKEWNTNLIRLAMYSYDYVNGNREKSLKILRQGIEYAIANDMYVIVDWHILKDNNPNQHLAEAIEFFNMISKEYANIPNILFEICNEPNGDCSWDDIKEYASLVIPVIRRHSPDAVILVGTPNYDREIQFPAQDPLDFKNIMYTFHFYATSHRDEFRDKLRNVVSNGTPIFITESGLTESNGDGTIDIESVRLWYNLVDSLHLNYTIWSLSNKEEESAIIKAESKATEFLGDMDLSPSGKFVRSIFRGENINEIPLEYDTSAKFKLMARNQPYLIWCLFAIPILLLLLITWGYIKIRKRFKQKKCYTYDDLLKYSKDPQAQKLYAKPGKVFLSEFFLMASTFCTLIYLCWRTTCSIPFAFGNIAIAGSIILLAVEILGFIETLIHYNNMLGFRDHPLPQIADDEFPDVDIFISTYNEPPEILRKTIIGCKHMEYPNKNKVHIYLCDDNRRIEMRALAEELGVHYFDRPDNKGAKAGNLNEALKRTNSPYIVTFDADMIPRREFLLKTIPYFVDAEKINQGLPKEKQLPLGLIQTPQSFYTPDVFQHNLYSENRIPNEQDFFYQVIEAAKTSSNSVIYGGSNTIIARRALEDIGGFYTESITEDFATGMLIESSGYASLGLSEPLASGIAPSTFQEHIQQRTRWGRGVIATAKQLKLIRRRKLSFTQKMSYLSSVLYWFSPIKNLIYLLSPLLFAVFCIPVFKCTLIDLAIFWLPMHIMQLVSLRVVSHNKISSLVSGIYETSVMPFLLIPVIKETFGITLSTFKVTKKESRSYKRTIDKKFLLPFGILLGLTLVGIVQMTYLMFTLEAVGILAVLFWLCRNMYYLTMCIFLGFGRDADGENVKVLAAENVVISKSSGDKIYGITTKLLEHSVDIFADEMDVLKLGDSIGIDIDYNDKTISVKGTVIALRQSRHPNVPSVYTIEILDFGGNKDEYIQMLYDRIPTLPQHIKMESGRIDSLWNNLAHRISAR